MKTLGEFRVVGGSCDTSIGVPGHQSNREHSNYYGENSLRFSFLFGDSCDTSIDVPDLQSDREHSNYYGENFRKFMFCLVISTTLV